MRKSNFAPRLQPSLLDEARQMAEAEGVALNQLINVARRNTSRIVPPAPTFQRHSPSSSAPASAIHRRRATSYAAPGSGRRLAAVHRAAAVLSDITPYDLMRMVLSSVKAEILVALPVWVAVRTIDFVMGGPARRRKHQGERKDP
jgi:hypothetical protein